MIAIITFILAVFLISDAKEENIMKQRKYENYQQSNTSR